MLMKLITILMFTYALTNEPPMDSFNEFSRSFGKEYSSKKEEIMGSFNFKQNNKIIENLSKMNFSFQIGITKFHDISHNQFINKYLTFKPEREEDEHNHHHIFNTGSFLLEVGQTEYNTDEMPLSWDWRDYGVVTPIRDQGPCGACWSFSTASNIESQYLLQYGEELDLSEQDLINCVAKNSGCDGGNMKNAFRYVKESNGVALEFDLPFKNLTRKCKLLPFNRVAPLYAYNKLKTDNEDDIAYYLWATGPLSVALNANHLQFYVSGILDIPDCDKENTNHAVNLIGYGEEDGQKYWIVRNSWGSDWGEKGYFRIKRGEGMCGINTYIMTSVLE
jgi:cathepsin F